MKNILKNLISVLTLVVIFSVIGANVSFAAISKVTFSASVAPGKGGSGSIKVLPPPPPLVIPGPTISGLNVDNISQTSAQIHASVNPNGLTTLASFWTNVPGSTGPLGTTNMGSGTSSVAMVPFTLNNLTPGTTYQFQVRATDSDGNTSNSTWMSFITPSTSAPIIISATATNITQTSAMLNGVINPNGVTTLATFWTNVPGSTGPLGTTNLGNGILNTSIIPFTLTGLTSGTNYTFEVRATNANGATVNSGWISFSTLGSNNNCTTPTISSISPDHVNEGAPATTVTVTGSNFGIFSSAEFNGSLRPTNVSSSTSLTMDLTASDLSSDGTESITVTNGSGCDSNAVTFTINNVGGGGGGGGGGGSHVYYPTVLTQNAGSISNVSVTLNGSVNPNGYATTSWFEFGTSSNLSTLSETVHVNQGSINSTLALAQSISGLVPNTTYYFRAVANNSYGTMKGNIFSFTTTRAPNGIVTTVQATNKTNASAKLNGIFINQAGASASGHFEYGTSLSLGKQTIVKDLGTSSSVSFSSIASNLIPNTIYYFRAVVVSQGSTYNGNILVFQTPSTSVNPPSIETEPTVTTTESSILKITNNVDKVAVGDEIDFLVTFNNTEAKNFENAKLSVQLPKEIDFVESNFGKYNSDNESVDFNPEILVPNQVGSITIKGKLNSKAQDGNILITTAIMSYNLEGSTESKDEIAYSTNHVISGNGLEANPLFGASFLPNTLLGWLALVLIILGLALIGRKFYTNYLAKNKTASPIDNLPM
ncbi:MAG: hypothetical protein WAV10_01570 [Minisyncoccia bacterium]